MNEIVLRFIIVCLIAAIILGIWATVMFFITSRPRGWLVESTKYNNTGMRSYYKYYEEMMEDAR